MDPAGHHHHLQLHHHQYSVSVSASAGGVGVDVAGSAGDRFPQWSIQETRDFLMIRAELDPTFMETKRNKLLWEVISTRMKEKGYNRSTEQCKCKWKNLVTRYKGCETMEAEGMRQQQFPFYNDLQSIFAARMQRMLWLEAEGAGAAASGSASASSSRLRRSTTAAPFSSDEDDENDDSDGEKAAASVAAAAAAGAKKKRKLMKSSIQNPSSGGNNPIVNGIREMMEEFTKQQMQMEMEWMKAYEAREEERRAKEMEWRRTMEALENERMMMERRWREREEQRRGREEARAEKRDALITALLNKLRREDHV